MDPQLITRTREAMKNLSIDIKLVAQECELLAKLIEELLRGGEMT